jgi:hypothetical protein
MKTTRNGLYALEVLACLMIFVATKVVHGALAIASSSD